MGEYTDSAILMLLTMILLVLVGYTDWILISFVSVLVGVMGSIADSFLHGYKDEKKRLREKVS